MNLILQLLAQKNGYFSSPKSLSINQNIDSSENSGDKRTFRIYLPYEANLSKQAMKMQNW